MSNSVQATLNQRNGTHGDFTENSRISQALKDTCRNSDGYEKLSSVQREAIDMIMHKVSRIMAGNPNEPDHWHDICGYAKLAENRCEVPTKPKACKR